MSGRPGLFRQFIRQKPRTIALGFIVLCVFLALFAYLITGDKTPDINEQITGIGLKRPGFKVTLIAFPKPHQVENPGFIKFLLNGKPNNFYYVPVSQYAISKDSLTYRPYDGDTPVNKIAPVTVHKAQWLLGNRVIDVVQHGQGYQVTLDDGRLKELARTEVDDQLKKQGIEERTFWLGTDLFGRSLMDRIVLGIRYSLFVGLLAVLISITIGTVIGMVSGYFGGKVDDVLSYIMNVFWSIPTLILVFAIVLVSGRGIQNIFIAVGLTMWVDTARLVRGQVLALKKEKYVESVRSMGMKTPRILWRHILPNMLGPLIVIAVSNFASAIIVESGLSYLGFGIQPPTPSLGSILSENYGFILSNKPFLAITPVVVLLLLVLAFNLVGNGVRDIFDVKSNTQT
ncbi:MAG: ABC transporter permease [Saprospiraceae bacterium]|nr:ABC transporter permease [Saprospiraceae bacterium]